jgi:GT2 family glycosyltransferase
MAPTLSTIIVNHNSARETIACVASLRANGGVEQEIIVVDNGSEADDRALLRDLDGASRLIEAPNDGFGAGCNRGAAAAAGTYLLFVNPDIVVPSPTALAELVAVAAREPRLGALGCRMVFDDGRLQLSAHHRDPDLVGHAWDYAPIVSQPLSRLFGLGPRSLFPAPRHEGEVLEARHLLGAFMLVPRDVFRQVGGFDEGFFLYREETDLCRRIAGLGRRILYTPTPVVVHTSAASTHNRHFANFDPRYMESTYRYFRLYHGPAYVAAAWLLALAGMTLSLAAALPARALARATRRRRTSLSELLVPRLRAAIAWHWRQRREILRPVVRRLPPAAAG